MRQSSHEALIEWWWRIVTLTVETGIVYLRDLNFQSLQLRRAVADSLPGHPPTPLDRQFVREIAPPAELQATCDRRIRLTCRDPIQSGTAPSEHVHSDTASRSS